MAIISFIYYLIRPENANGAGLFSYLLGPEPATASDLIVLVATVKNIMTATVGSIAVAMFLWGVFKLFMAKGDSNKVNDAKKVIFASLIGLSIVIAAGFAVNTFIGVTS